MILGTHTSDGEPNYLQLVSVRIPTDTAQMDARKYDDEKGELGGYGSFESKIQVLQRISHAGEVNRCARARAPPAPRARSSCASLQRSPHAAEPDGDCLQDGVGRGAHL